MAVDIRHPTTVTSRQAVAIYHAISAGNIDALEQLLTTVDARTIFINYDTLLTSILRLKNYDMAKRVIDIDVAKRTATSDHDQEESKALVDTAGTLGVTPLVAAILRGDMDAVELLFKNGANPLAAYPGAYTALMAAVKVGNITLAKLLVDVYGADVNYFDKEQCRSTALIIAIGNADKGMVKWLLDKGANVNTVSSMDITPFMLSTSLGFADISELLLSSSMDVNAANNYGTTALMTAAEMRSVKLTQQLLDKGAAVNARTQGGHTALTLAVLNCCTSVAKLLLANGADATVVTSKGVTLVQLAYDNCSETLHPLLISAGADETYTDKFGNTSLIRAADAGQEQLVSKYLDKGADINAANKDGDTALIRAAHNGHDSIVDILVKAGANVDATNKVGNTALMQAADKKHWPILQMLVEAGADVNKINADGNTAALILFERSSYIPSNYLINHGADVSIINNAGMSILSEMFERGRLGDADKISWVKARLRAGANINAVDRNGNSLVALQVLKGENSAVEALLKLGVDPNIRNNTGQTALMLAVGPPWPRVWTPGFHLWLDQARDELVRTLVIGGANVNVRDTKGHTALAMTIKYSLYRTAATLLNGGAYEPVILLENTRSVCRGDLYDILARAMADGSVIKGPVVDTEPYKTIMANANNIPKFTPPSLLHLASTFARNTPGVVPTDPLRRVELLPQELIEMLKSSQLPRHTTQVWKDFVYARFYKQ